MIGMVAFEYSYYLVRRHRDPKFDELNAHFPSFRRLDAKNWARYKFYPGAILFCIPRTLFIWATFGFAVPLIWLTLRGQDLEKPITGCRRIILRFWY